jgi:hypothetical protein
MTTFSTEAYTAISPTAARLIEAVPMPDVTSIVFVVDDDVSVRESLELLIKTAGWQPETSRRHRSSWFVEAPWFRAAWCPT